MKYNNKDLKIFTIPGDGMKRKPEREDFAMQPNASRPAHSILIRVMFHAVTR